jgi:hypothetical protein
MREAVIEIASFGQGRLGVRLWKAAAAYVDAMNYRRVRLELPALPKLDTSVNVDSYATQIRDALCSHPAIKSELEQIASTTPAVLRFLVGVPEAEGLRWEAVSMEPYTRFLALKPDCAVTRIAHASDLRDPGVRTFGLPLRMMAFLSPARIPAKDELEAICTQVLVARQKGLALTCSIYLGEQDLIDEQRVRIEAGELPGIEIAGIPPSSLAVEQVIRSQPPELLHFFCHGMTDAGERLVELATINDWDVEQETGSVTLTIERLRQVLISTGATWLTVLNSCSGAQPVEELRSRAVEQLHSMALALAQSASPVAVGMAEPIDAADATLFARAFYGRLFDILRTSLAEFVEGDTAVLDLAPAVNAARAELHQTYQNAPPDAFGRWCLPLLYERDAPLRVMMMPQDVKTRIELVAGALRSLPATTPRAVRASILATLSNPPPVPERLRPDIFGNLG